MTEEERKRLLSQINIISKDDTSNEANQIRARASQQDQNFFADVGRVFEATGAGISSTLSNLGKGALLAGRDLGGASDFADKITNEMRNKSDAELEDIAKKTNISTTTLKDYINKSKTSYENINDFSANTFDKWANEANQRVQELQAETDNPFTKEVIGFMPNLSQQAVNVGVSFINPALVPYVAGLEAKGSYYNDAKQRGMTDEQANDFSTAMAGVEAFTEKLTVKDVKAGITKIGEVKSLLKGGIKGATKEATQEAVKETTKSGIKEAFKSLAKGMGENAFQEGVTEIIQEAFADAITKKDLGQSFYDFLNQKDNWEDIWGRVFKSAVGGALSAGITGGVGMGVRSCVSVNNKIQNGEQVTQQEILQANQDAIEKSKTLPKEQQEQFNEQITQGSEIGIQNVINQVETEQNQVPTEPNRAVPMQTSENAQQQVQEQEQQTISNETENALNQNVEPQNLVESAERSGIDVKDEKTRKNLEVIQKFNENRGVKATFDTDAFKGHDNVNSFFRTDENGNREIVFNPNTMTDKTIEQLAVHEVYHDMVAGGTAQELTDFVVQKMSNNPEYQEYVRALQDVYEEQDSDIIKEEAVAHYLEKNLGTNEFISELQERGDRTTIQRIIDTIKDMITKAKNTLTGKGDLNYLLDLQRKYEQAYRGEFKGTQEQTKLSKQVNAQDNQGRTLTKEQQDYFKDSKARDENGNLKTFYHKTGSNFNTIDFKKNAQGVFWFTDSKQALESGEVSANGVRPGQDANIKEFYVDMKNPASWEEYDKYGIEQLKEKGYDGVLLDDDGITTGFVFNNSNQVKDIDNTNPTKSGDMRFSKSEDAKGNVTDNLDAKNLSPQEIVDNIDKSDGTLLAVHNLSEKKLNGILELGGFPVPSIAITDPSKVDHSQFGDISVVFDKNSIDPSNSLNEVFDRDVWSPVFPTLEYDINNEDIKKYITDKHKYNSKDSIVNDAIIKYMYAENLATEVDRYGKEKTLENLKNDKSMQYFYKTQIEKDPNYQPEMETKKYNNLHENATLQKFVDEFNKTHDMSLADFYYHYINYRDMQLSQSDRTTLENQIKEAVRPEIEEYYKKHNPFENRNVTNASELLNNAIQEELNADVKGWNFENFIRDASQLEKEGINNQIIDEEKTLENITNKIDKEKYNKWIDDTYGEMFKNIKRGIRNDKEIYTASGNRRSFDKLHDEYNLQNVVNAMISKSTQGGEGGFTSGGFGEIQAKRANKFDTISEIKAFEDRLATSEQANEQLAPIKEKIQSDIAKLSDYYKSSSMFSSGFENSAQAISEFSGKKNLTEANFKKVLNSYYNFDVENIPKSLYTEIINDLNSLNNIATDYFEAKPQRAVGLDEVATIVIPEGRAELKQALQDRGLDVIEYNPDIDGDRQAKLNELSEYKFSQQGQGTSQDTINNFLEKTKVNEGTGTAIKDLARVQEETTEPVRQVAPSEAPAQVPQVNEVKQRQVEPIRDITDVERPQVPQNQKTRKTYESIINSNQMTQEAKQIAKELMGYDTYVPQTNEFTLAVADRNIKQNGVDESLTTLTNKINNNNKVDAIDIATGERLIEYYSKIGDRQKLQEAIQSTAMAGTEAGRAVQAMSMINHQTPIGQVTWIQRSVDKVNKRLAKEGRKAQFNFTPEMQQKILNSTSENLQQNLNEVYQELGKQVPKSNMEKFNEWRYFSMLANPKTHIRNILGNTVMKAVQNMKNKVAGTIEDFVIGDNAERWNSLKGASKGMYEFAKNDLKNADVQSMLGLNENKYNPQSRLQQNQRTFKSDLLEKTLGKAFELNSKALEVEDGWGLKSGYAKAMANYLNANNLDYNNLTDAQLQKARNYAVQQAKEATFHQDNTVANVLQTWENKNLFTKVALGGAIPFKKTPMNVALTGFEYSPAGFAKTLTTDLANLRKGKISANQFIDNISKNLTGTAISILGYGLTQAGILKASGGGDEDKNEFEEATGKQNYSIQIGDKTYSLDWLTPAGIPLFIGSELYQVSHQKEDGNKTKNENEAFKSITKILDATASAMNPMSEMTMISGLTDALKSYAQGSTKSIENMLANVGKSYATQAVPTALGQIARSTDEYERSTTSTETDPMAKAIDSAKNQIISKIPGLRETLPISTDVWGNARETQSYEENAILPWTSKEISNDPVNKALTDLYDATGESGVLPDNYIDKSLTIDKEKYKLTNEEYAQLKQQYGKTAHDILANLTKSKEYEQMSDEQRVKAVKEAYSYAKSTLKVTYSDENNLDAEESSTYKKVQSVIDNGGDAKEYFEYTGLIDGVKKEKEKRQILLNSNLKDKGAIYESTIGSDDETYQIMKATGIDPDAYLDYKQQDFSSDKEDDGTIKGKTVSGSGKTKFYDYMDNANMTYEQKLLLTGMKYKLLPGERDTLANYIDTLPISASDKTDIYKKLKGATVYQNGEIYY